MADQQEKAHSSKACLCQCATFEPLSAPFGSAGACQFSHAAPLASLGAARVCGRGCALLCATLIFSADHLEKAPYSKASLCQWATVELLSAPFGSAGACPYSYAGLKEVKLPLLTTVPECS